MKKNLTELVFILDKSGSMQGLEQDTIGGFNAMIEKQKKEEGDVIVSTILFNSEYDFIHDKIRITDVPLMSSREYFVGGCTALLDTVGIAIESVVRNRKNTPKSKHPAKTIFIITTDGKENASVKYDYKKIKDMIKFQQKRYGWEFIFLGANIDVREEAERMGVLTERSVAFHCDSEGIDLCYETVSEAISMCRMNRNLNDNSWRKKIDEDFKSR